jgi:hypothetical protein
MSLLRTGESLREWLDPSRPLYPEIAVHPFGACPECCSAPFRIMLIDEINGTQHGIAVCTSHFEEFLEMLEDELRLTIWASGPRRQ